MKTKMAALAAALFFAIPAFADDLQGLCEQAVEGSYIAKFISDKARINIICLTNDRMVGSFTQLLDDHAVPGASISGSASFSHATIDDGQLILSDFPVNNEDRRGHSSKGMVSYLRLNIQALKNHELRGTYMRGNMAKFAPIIGTLETALPRFGGTLKAPLIKANATGVYGVAKTQFGPTHVIFDVLGDTPVIYLRPDSGSGTLHFLDGPKWDGTGIFTSATPEGNGGEPDDKKLFVIRGHFVDGGQLEYYMVSPVKIEGPLRAARTNDFQGEDLPPGVTIAPQQADGSSPSPLSSR